MGSTSSRPNGTGATGSREASGSFSWSRDGQRLAIAGYGEVAVVRAGGRGFRRLRLRGFGLIERLEPVAGRSPFRFRRADTVRRKERKRQAASGSSAPTVGVCGA